MSRPIDSFIDKIKNQFEEHGINDYVILMADPDSNIDLFRLGGSCHWCYGMATAVCKRIETYDFVGVNFEDDGGDDEQAG